MKAIQIFTTDFDLILDTDDRNAVFARLNQMSADERFNAIVHEDGWSNSGTNWLEDFTDAKMAEEADDEEI